MSSTTVTWAPRRAQTLPSSRPIAPPPITAIRSGTPSRDRASVEVTNPSSPTGKTGRLTGTLPVASTIASASRLRSAPP